MTKYITAAQADEMRRRALATAAWYTAPDRAEGLRDLHRLHPGIDYYIVPDHDPRVGTTEDIEDLRA